MASTGRLPTNFGSGVTQASATAEQAFSRNCETALVAASYTLQTVIEWHAHDKSPGETFLEYTVRIDQNLAQSEARQKQRKKIEKTQKPKWNERSLNASFDTTVCAAMLRMMLDIAKESKMLTEEEYDKMVAAVKAIKDKRNELMHSPTLAYDANWRSGMAPKLHDMLQLAGRLYGRDKGEIQSAADELQKKLNYNLSLEEKERIKNDATLLGGKSVAGEIVLKFFGKEKSTITRKTVERKKIFHALKLLLEIQPHTQNEIEYSKLFDDPDCEQFIIISGYPGAGKSTLAKNIALQFYSPDSPKASLTDFDLLVFHEFRDRNINDFKDIVSKNYKSVCDVIGVESTVECLLKRKVLYVIDGYDEKNKPSVDALDDLISKVREGESKVIITSRPNAAVELERYLDIKNVQFQHYTIARINKLKNQIDFLTKHQSFFHDTNNPTSDVVTAFQNLNKTLRKELDLPIYLIQFCKIHWRDPLTIRNWKTFNDFSKGVRKLFRDLIVDRFPTELTNKNDLAENLLLVVGEVALEKIQVNTLLFSDAEYLDMRTRLRQVLKEEKVIGVDVDIILEVVLLSRTSFFDFDSLAYEFNHKSICERLASSFVAHRLRSDGNISLKKLLLGSTFEYSNENLVVNATSETLGRTTQSTTYSLARFLEVLQYVARDLSASNQHHLRAHWHQLREALLHSGARLNNWCELVLSCPQDTLLVRLAAEAARDQEEEWVINNGRDAAAVARMLQYAQPQMLYVRVAMKGFHSMKTSWTEIAKLRDGNLKIHVGSPLLGLFYAPCDNLLAPLQQSRCRLQYLDGGIVTAAGVAAVASVATPTAELNILLHAPLDLNSLQGKYRTLKIVWIRPLDAGDEGQGPAPLPAQPPPALVVNMKQCPVCPWQDVAHTVLTLAPVGNRYSRLSVQYCKFEETELDRLVALLHRQGIRTQSERHSRYELEHHPYFEWVTAHLHITDVLPVILATLD